jgi:hypothetical protein
LSAAVARELQVNVQVVDFAQEIFYRVFRKVPTRIEGELLLLMPPQLHGISAGSSGSIISLSRLVRFRPPTK